MKKLMCFIGAVAAAGSLLAADESAEVSTSKVQPKVMLRISAPETPDSRLPEWKPSAQPPVLEMVPYSPEQIDNAKPEDVKRMLDDNARVERANFSAKQRFQAENWKSHDDYMRGVRGKLGSTPFGKQILTAIDKFSSIAANEFDPECIEMFNYNDAAEQNDTAAFQSKGGGMKVYKETYYLKMIFEHPSKPIEAPLAVGGGQVVHKFFTQRMNFIVKDSGGKTICGDAVKEERDTTNSSGALAEEMRIEMIEECLKKAAKKISDFFVAKVVFKAVPATKGDDDFNEDAATLTVDGVDRSFGDEIGLLKAYTHDVRVEMDGYKQKGGKTMKFAKSETKKIVMSPTTCMLTVNVKGPAGFDASSATIELVGADGASESLTSGEETKVQQGKWTLKVSADGYSAKPKALNLTSNKKVENITVVKEAAPAAGANAQ